MEKTLVIDKFGNHKIISQRLNVGEKVDMGYTPLPTVSNVCFAKDHQELRSNPQLIDVVFVATVD